MRPSFIVLLACTALGCGQVLGLGDFGEGGSNTGAHGGSAGAAGGGGSAGAAGGGSGGVEQGGGGSGGEAGCVGDYSAVVMVDMPASYIRFEETSGPTVEDHINRPGTVEPGVDLNVAGLPPCVGGSAVGFNGVADSHVDFGGVLNFEGKSSFSLEVWLNSAALAGMVIRKLGAIPRTGYTLAYSNDRLKFHRYLNDTTDSVSVDSSILGTGATHHVVATYDGVAQWMCFYVDGVSRDCDSSLKSIGADSGSFEIGTASFEGVIDEVAVYGSALSPERIAAHYTAGIGKSPSP